MGERGREGEGRGTGWREETERDGGGGGSGPRMGAASGHEGPYSWRRVTARGGGFAYIPQTAPPPRKGEESGLANCISLFQGQTEHFGGPVKVRRDQELPFWQSITMRHSPSHLQPNCHNLQNKPI